jgi:hypothetical protein
MVSKPIETFFQDYARAAESMDAEALASMHHAPCIKVHGDGRIECLLTHDMVRAFFEELGGKYAERDHGHSRWGDLLETPLGSAAVLASITWEQFRKDGSLYRSFRRSYNLVRVGGDWKILTAIAHRV